MARRPFEAASRNASSCGIVAFGDIAALRRVDRRRFDQRDAQAARPARHGRPARQKAGRAARAVRARFRAHALSAAAAARPSRRSARSRGVPRPAARRASARAKSGIAFSAGVHARAGSHRRAARPQARAALDRASSVRGALISSQSSRRPAAVWQRSISPSRLPATLPRDRARKLQAVARRGVDRHVTCAATRRGASSKHARALLRRVEIGE